MHYLLKMLVNYFIPLKMLKNMVGRFPKEKSGFENSIKICMKLGLDRHLITNGQFIFGISMVNMCSPMASVRKQTKHRKWKLKKQSIDERII